MRGSFAGTLDIISRKFNIIGGFPPLGGANMRLMRSLMP